MNYKRFIVFLCLFSIYTSVSSILHGQDSGGPALPAGTNKPRLTYAAMCESVKEPALQKKAVVFSIETGKIFCLTSFSGICDQTYVYHKWFHRDELTTKKRLLLKPPQWSTASTIQLREADKGPWRVELTDDNDNILHVLRFSIVD